MSGIVGGAPNLSVINAITQFVNGTQAIWNTITVPIPIGLVVYATDTTVVKMGDGSSLYANLPVLFTISSIITLTQQITTLNQMQTTQAGQVTTLQTGLTSTNTNVANLQTAVQGIAAPGSAVISQNNATVQMLSTVPFYGIQNSPALATQANLPTTPVSNENHIIKDLTGTASGYPITISGNGNHIDGLTQVMITTNWGEVEVWWTGSSWSLRQSWQKPNLFVHAGNPNGSVAGNAAGATQTNAPPDVVWDTAGMAFWICSTTGTASTAVWKTFAMTDFVVPVNSIGAVSSGTTTLNRALGIVSQITASGTFALALSNWTSVGFSEIMLELTNGGSATITMPSNVNWITSTGTTTTSFASAGIALQTVGTDWITFFSPDGGTTIYGKAVR